MELKLVAFGIKMGIQGIGCGNVKNCFYMSQGCKIAAFLLIHLHVLLNAGLS